MPEPEKEPNPFESPEAECGGAQPDPGTPQTALIGALAAAAVSFLIAFGLFLVTPGLGVIAAMLLVPANLRAFLAMRKELQSTGTWPQGWQQASALVISALIMIPVWIATGIAFSAVCWAGAMIGLSAFPKGDEYGFSNMLYGGIPIGLIAGLISFVLCFRLTLRSISTPTGVDEEKSKPIS
ncbi:hypothetical protein C5Y96_21120 [Blastopirellula marina]|uniref:Uncharacterized protein n=1 Tax=Blastopirellula marina TaxID=124 RepID=A0A2S8F1I2_9BACT|nr:MULTISPECIES: hypothetical protein [Pirellulaceae]PQO25957.1 hypothetical protein C5Y96_21120 [Blastopirellula marina]RCS44315.1 hypothetical protein DTL36_21165 [Bremerella cremea]